MMRRPAKALKSARIRWIQLVVMSLIFADITEHLKRSESSRHATGRYIAPPTLLDNWAV